MFACVFGVVVVTAASCSSSESGDDEQGRFGDVDGSTTVHPDAGGDDDACADAFPPCAFVSDGGPGADLDASAEPPQDGGASCAYSGTCQQARDLGSIQGDGSAETKTATGYASQWLGIRVTELDSGVRASPMSFTASLEVPTGTNFDLYVYMDTGTDQVACATLVRKSTKGTGVTDAISMSWGESGYFANRADDSRPVRFEIRHVSGTCDPKATWKLTIAGNKQ